MDSEKSTSENYVFYWEQIRRFFPDLPIHSYEWIHSGFHSVALILNSEWVFRFPLKPEFYNEYRQEKLVLKHLYPSVSYRVPQIELFETEKGLFSRHLFLSGTQYTFASKELTFFDKEQIAFELADFLVQMHSIPCTDLNLETGDWSGEVCTQSDCLKAVLCENQMTKFYQVIADFQLEAEKLKSQECVLCHTDLNENNFLIQNKKLSGIIDFGNTSKQPRSADFASLLKYDFAFILKVAQAYQKISGIDISLKYALLIQKLRCYGGIAENPKDEKRFARYNGWLMALEANEHLLKDKK